MHWLLRDRHLRRIPRAEMTSSPLDGPDQVGAFLQEIKAGAAPLTGIVAVPAEIPTPDAPHRLTVATVPFLTTPLIPWKRVTTGDPFGQLIHLLQNRGGLWLAKRTTAVVEWTIGPTTPAPRPNRPEAWVRVDVTLAGVWNGRFALAGPASGLADHLWCLAMSPVIGVLPEEVRDQALPHRSVKQPVTWKALTRALDNTLHTTTQPSEAIRRLVVESGWPGAERLRD